MAFLDAVAIGDFDFGQCGVGGDAEDFVRGELLRLIDGDGLRFFFGDFRIGNFGLRCAGAEELAKCQS